MVVLTTSLTDKLPLFRQLSNEYLTLRKKIFISILFPAETDFIHVILEFVGYVERESGKDSVSNHFVKNTGSVAKKRTIIGADCMYYVFKQITSS